MATLAQPGKTLEFAGSPRHAELPSRFGAAPELEAPVTLLLMLLYVGFAAFLMFSWGGFGSAFANSIDDGGAVAPASLAAYELE